MSVEQAAAIALAAALGLCLVLFGVMRWRRRTAMQRRVRALGREWHREALRAPVDARNPPRRNVVGRLGQRLALSFPAELKSLAARADRAGLSGGISTSELLGWKLLCTAFGAVVGVAFVARYGAIGLVMLLLGVTIGWFGIDLMLARTYGQRRREILRDLPTVMDLLVLSLEAGMGLDRALRTVIHEYRSALSDEIRRVLHDIDLGLGRGEAFERMAERVGLEELRSLSRSIVQSEELGVSLVSVLLTQSQEVRRSRRRAAEAEAQRAPIKMLIPLVLFILPTLFMLLLVPVGLRAVNALGGRP